MGIFGDYRLLSGCGFLTGFLCLTLGALVLQANPKSRSCQLAFLFNLSVANWAIFYAGMYLVPPSPLAILMSQLLTFGTVNLNAFFSHLVVIVTKREKKWRPLLFVNYALAILLNLLIFTPHVMIRGASAKMGFPSYTNGGPFYFLIPIYLFSNILFSTWQLIQGMRRTSGYRKSQLSLFLAATLIGYVAGVPAFFLVFDIPIKPVTTPLVSLYPLILTYAIVKHRFLDIKKLVKNTLIFSLLFVGLLGFVSIILSILKGWISRWVGLSEPVAQGIAIALVIGLYGPLKTGLSQLTNRLLFQHLPNPETIFTKVSADIMHYLDTKKLADEVTARIAQILALDRIGFYTRSRTNSYMFELQACLGRLRKKQIHQSKQLIQYLEKSKDFLVNPHTQRETRLFSRQKPSFALTNMKEVKKQATMELAALGGVAAFPVFVKESLRAVLVMGRKKSDAPWREEEFQILKSFMRHLSLALGNAEYAEEIQRFREKLSLSERDASAGALISGVHHEASGPIHAMTLNLSNLAEDLENPEIMTLPRSEIEDLVVETMESVRQGVFKINGIIQQLSDLAERKPLTIEEGVRPAVIADKILREVAGKDASDRILVRSKIPRNLTLSCDPSALYDILANLIRNAQQAIPEKGEITIEGASRNGEAGLLVRDTGVGIPGENMGRIFEPFYTTKTKKDAGGAVGTGMGLFLVKEFMEGMGGRIEVESEPGKGTTFHLLFPNLERMLGRSA